MTASTARAGVLGGAAGALRPPRERTIGSMWRAALEERRARPAYLVEEIEGWRGVPWTDVARRVDDAANGLLELGVRRGQPVAILATTGLEWIVADLALALIGAITVPIYPASSAHEVRHILGDAKTIGLIVEHGQKLDELGELPELRFVVRLDELQALEGSGRQYAARHPGALDAALASVREDDVFTIQYTSGTTGSPKGCVVLHRNYVDMARILVHLPGLVGDEETVLLFLPLAHNFGRLLYLAGVEIGFTTALLAEPRRVAQALSVVRPTILPSVPRVYEKLHAAIQDRFAEARGLRRRLTQWALALGYRTSPYRLEQRPLPRALALQHRAAERLVYRKIQARVGGRLRLGISGGAPLAPDVARFFHALGILILEGYGQSECTTACAVNLPGCVRFGTVGRALPGVEIRIASDGEILVRGRTVFAGYLNDPDATREVLDGDGWLATGDIGKLDGDGFLAITDRKRDLIVTASGENIAPQPLEHALASSRLVESAVVVGNGRPYLTALLALDDDELTAWRARRSRDGGAGAAERALRAELQAVVDRVNATVARPARIRRFAIAPRAFSAADEEVTPTLKLKRRVIEEHFEQEIAELYR